MNDEGLENELKSATALDSAIDECNATPVSEAWFAEAERRCAEFDAGAVKARPWREVKERARNQRA
jgi:putative addiction module component (TIGR02574 family)